MPKVFFPSRDVISIRSKTIAAKVIQQVTPGVVGRFKHFKKDKKKQVPSSDFHLLH